MLGAPAAFFVVERIDLKPNPVHNHQRCKSPGVYWPAYQFRGGVYAGTVLGNPRVDGKARP